MNRRQHDFFVQNQKEIDCYSNPHHFPYQLCQESNVNVIFEGSRVWDRGGGSAIMIGLK